MLIDKLIRVNIIEKLKDNVSINGNSVPVFNNVPNSQTKPYIEIIGQNTVTDGGNKDNRAFLSNVPIRILTVGYAGAGGDEEADIIEQQVIDLIDNQVQVQGYSVVSDDYTSLTLNQDNGREYQTNKILNFFFTVYKN